MSSFTRPIILAVLLTSTAGAHAGDRCEGTLCDLYYGNSPPPAATPAPATPMTAPKNYLFGGLFSGGDSQPAPGSQAAAQPAPAKAPFVSVDGGGVLGMARGAPSERCGGTLCDLFYGGPSPEEQRQAQGPQTPSPPAGASGIDRTIPPRINDADVVPRAAKRRRNGVAYANELQEKPQCVAPPADPWRCYRK